MTTNSHISNKYQKLTQIKHILKLPGMYIGTPDIIENNVWVLENNKIIKKNINYSPGLYKIFDEIIVNSYDQTIRDSTVSQIKVNINEKENSITVFNDGIGIDVVMHPKEKIYVPELIFGHLLTSTTFDLENTKKRITGGVHGLGAKLTAIFSKYFEVEIGDSINKKKFYQYYQNNLSKKSKPIITKYNKKKGYVKIKFIPDLKYFNYERLDESIISLFKRRVYDLAAITDGKIKIFLDDELLNVNFQKYIELTTHNKFINFKCGPKSINPNRWKIAMAKSNGEKNSLSFVNGIYTNNGGYHLRYIVDNILSQLKKYIDKKYKIDIKKNFLKNSFWFYVVSTIENPTFSSQTKDELMTPVSKFGSTCDLIINSKKIIDFFDLDDDIKLFVKKQNLSIISKTKIKKKNLMNKIKGLYDANYAGTKKSSKCTLILTEGDSASTMAISGLSAIKNSNDYYGVYSLKGKMINPRDLKLEKVIKNEKFNHLKNILGLEFNKIYNDSNQLRYGSIMIMTDADPDGSHIKGLIFNLFQTFWPSLLKLDSFVKIFITPIIKITINNKILDFFTISDFEKWKKNNDTIKYKIKYYKGLGTNTSKEAKEYFLNIDKHLMLMKWTPDIEKNFSLAFSKNQSDERKNWLKKYNPHNVVNFNKKILTYDTFINKELIHFSSYDNYRSIPSVIDGLKPAQRKILYSAIKLNTNNDIKVSRFSGYVSENTSYHHGENSLNNAIINMASDYIGSNNINLLVPNGQFGTRLHGGKDHASPRYIFTKLNEISQLIFHKDDSPLLEYLNDDGLQIEPKFYIPIIPTILINGSLGIGTGFKSDVPKYNPLDIISSLKNKLIRGKFNKFEPWYRHFNGDIIKLNNMYITKGKYVIEKNFVTITELPIGIWTTDYLTKLRELVQESDIIKQIKNNSNDVEIKIVLKFISNESILKLQQETYDNNIDGIEKYLFLYSSFNTNSMNLNTEDYKIKKYKTQYDIIREFFDIRIKYYKLRKSHLVEKLSKDIKFLSSKLKFITSIINNKINIYNKNQPQIISILSKMKLEMKNNSYDYLLNLKFSQFTKINVDINTKKLKDMNKQLEFIEKKTTEQMWLDDLIKLEDYILNNFKNYKY